MDRTYISTQELKNDNIGREDLNITSTGKAVVRKVTTSTGLSIDYTGIDNGTGDVLILRNPEEHTFTSLTDTVDSYTSTGHKDFVGYNSSTGKLQFYTLTEYGFIQDGKLYSDVSDAPQLTFKTSSGDTLGILEVGTSTGLPPSFNDVPVTSNFISGRVFNAVWNDIAECMPSDGSVKSGDLVCLDVNSTTFRVKKLEKDDSLTSYIGICSSNPGIIVGVNPLYEHNVFVTLKGMVWLPIYKKSLTSGNILYYDHIQGFNSEEKGIKLGLIIETTSDTVRVFV